MSFYDNRNNNSNNTILSKFFRTVIKYNRLFLHTEGSIPSIEHLTLAGVVIYYNIFEVLCV